MRAVQLFRDIILGLIIEVNEAVYNQKSGFLIRDQYKIDPGRFECPECDEKLTVAVSGNNNIYFRHYPGSGYCILKDESIDNEVLQAQNSYLHNKESDRHKELKNLIGNSLKAIAEVQENSIVVDTKFIIKGNDKRRPDVYCLYGERELVFEIQLSPLSPRFIHQRLKFYVEHGIYVLWILDLKGDPFLLSNMQRDIKYLFKSQNLFSLDEQSDSLQLICNYKQPFQYEMREIRDKWIAKTVQLGDLKFDRQEVQVYYSDYAKERNNAQLALVHDIRDSLAKKEVQDLVKQNQKIQQLIDKIGHHWKNDYNCYHLLQELVSLNDIETEILNSIVKLNRSNMERPPLCHYIGNYKKKSDKSYMSFIEFLLTQTVIILGINHKDPEGRGALIELYQNFDLAEKMYVLIPLLFKRGYVITGADENFLQENPHLCHGSSDIELLKLTYHSRLRYFSNDPIRSNWGYFLFIESAIRGKIIGSNVKSWVQFMMPILSTYRQYWKYTQIVLSNTSLGQILASTDKKSTIRRKILEHGLDLVEQDEEFNEILKYLYPEIFFF